MESESRMCSKVHLTARLVGVLMLAAGCSAEAARTDAGAARVDVPAPHAVGQWIWTRADLEVYSKSAPTIPGLEAGIFIGSVSCDALHGRLNARAGLSAASAQAGSVTPVIRFEDGLYQCRHAHESDSAFDVTLDSAVRVLRARVTGVAVRAIHLDYDAPQRALAVWSRSVRFLRARSLHGDSVWVTSLIAHLREPEFGDLFRDVVDGHVLQAFDTGEEATDARVAEALRLAARANVPFRLGLGAFERQTKAGPTNHVAWFATVSQFSAVRGYGGLWVFPAGQRWIPYLRAKA
jgi:hypothetical protein